MNDQITISHTPEEGTLATGDTRPHAAILKQIGFRWSRNLGAWFIPNSRDRLPRDYTIKDAETALTRAGATVTLDVSREIVSTAEREAHRAERIENRQDALSAKAERKATESTARYNASSAIAQRIPFGQPILVGHHSERGHRADLEKIRRHMDASCELAGESADAARKAAASERNSSYRLTGPATLRRIERMEARQRDITRKLEQATAGSSWHQRLVEHLQVIEDDLSYWRGHVAALATEGFKVWSAADFTPGDLVKTAFGWHKVVRVNAKSLSVETGYTWTDKIPYDRVKGRTPAAEAA
jgi:uncharacterized protein DUF3560